MSDRLLPELTAARSRSQFCLVSAYRLLIRKVMYRIE
jgi:hypothetical protein